MAIALVGSTVTARGGAGTCVVSKTTTAGNLLVLTVQHQGGALTSVTDDGGNTWTLEGDTTAQGATSQRLVGIYTCLNANAMTAVTVVGTGVIQCLVEEWSGAGARGASPAVRSNASGASPASAQVTGVSVGDLLYGCLAYVEAVAGTPQETMTGGGYTTTVHFDNAGASTTAVTGAYSLSVSGTTGPTWTMSPSASTGEVTVTFTPAVSSDVALALESGAGAILLEDGTPILL